MALRWSTAAGRLLVAAALLGVGCAQGSGSHAHTGQMPLVAVLGTGETRSVPVAAPAATTTTTGPAPAATTTAATTTAAPAPATTTTLAPATTLATATTVVAHEAAPAPDDAPAPEDVPEPAPDHEGNDLAARTLARISYPWRTRLPGWEIVFLDARPALRGVTFPAPKRIEIYVRRDDTADSLARVVAHELGHAADVTLNDALDRSRWRAARAVGPTVPWWPNTAATDFATMGGDFAEAFAVWQTGVASMSTVAGPPTDDQLALLAALVS